MVDERADEGVPAVGQDVVMGPGDGVVGMRAAGDVDIGTLAAGVFLDNVEVEGLAGGMLGVPHCFWCRWVGGDVEANGCVFPVAYVVAEFEIRVLEEEVAEVESVEVEVENVDNIIRFRYEDHCRADGTWC